MAEYEGIQANKKARIGERTKRKYKGYFCTLSEGESKRQGVKSQATFVLCSVYSGVKSHTYILVEAAKSSCYLLNVGKSGVKGDALLLSTGINGTKTNCDHLKEPDYLYRNDYLYTLSNFGAITKWKKQQGTNYTYQEQLYHSGALEYFARLARYDYDPENQEIAILEPNRRIVFIYDLEGNLKKTIVEEKFNNADYHAVDVALSQKRVDVLICAKGSYRPQQVYSYKTDDTNIEKTAGIKASTFLAPCYQSLIPCKCSFAEDGVASKAVFAEDGVVSKITLDIIQDKEGVACSPPLDEIWGEYVSEIHISACDKYIVYAWRYGNPAQTRLALYDKEKEQFEWVKNMPVNADGEEIAVDGKTFKVGGTEEAIAVDLFKRNSNGEIRIGLYRSAVCQDCTEFFVEDYNINLEDGHTIWHYYSSSQYGQRRFTGFCWDRYDCHKVYIGNFRPAYEVGERAFVITEAWEDNAVDNELVDPTTIATDYERYIEQPFAIKYTTDWKAIQAKINLNAEKQGLISQVLLSIPNLEGVKTTLSFADNVLCGVSSTTTLAQDGIKCSVEFIDYAVKSRTDLQKADFQIPLRVVIGNGWEAISYIGESSTSDWGILPNLPGNISFVENTSAFGFADMDSDNPKLFCYDLMKKEVVWEINIENKPPAQELNDPAFALVKLKEKIFYFASSITDEVTGMTIIWNPAEQASGENEQYHIPISVWLKNEYKSVFSLNTDGEYLYMLARKDPGSLWLLKYDEFLSLISETQIMAGDKPTSNEWRLWYCGRDFFILRPYAAIWQYEEWLGSQSNYIQKHQGPLFFDYEGNLLAYIKPCFRYGQYYYPAVFESLVWKKKPEYWQDIFNYDENGNIKFKNMILMHEKEGFAVETTLEHHWVKAEVSLCPSVVPPPEPPSPPPPTPTPQEQLLS